MREKLNTKFHFVNNSSNRKICIYVWKTANCKAPLSSRGNASCFFLVEKGNGSEKFYGAQERHFKLFEWFVVDEK